MLTVNEKFNIVSNYLNEALSPHLAKYSKMGMKNSWDNLVSKMLNTWKKSMNEYGKKITNVAQRNQRIRIDKALRNPRYREAMAKKYGVTI